MKKILIFLLFISITILGAEVYKKSSRVEAQVIPPTTVFCGDGLQSELTTFFEQYSTTTSPSYVYSDIYDMGKKGFDEANFYFKGFIYPGGTVGQAATVESSLNGVDWWSEGSSNFSSTGNLFLVTKLHGPYFRVKISVPNKFATYSAYGFFKKNH